MNRLLSLFAAVSLAATALAQFEQAKVPTINPAEKAKEVVRLEAMPVSTYTGSAAVGTTLGEAVETLAVACNMSYIALPEGDLKGELISFNLYDTPWGALNTICGSHSVEILYEQSPSGRPTWRFLPIKADELVSRTYVLKHNTHESIQPSKLDDGGMDGQNGQNGSSGVSTSSGGGGSGKTSSSENPLTAQIEAYLKTGTKAGGEDGSFVKWISDANLFFVKTTVKKQKEIEEFLAKVDSPIPQIQLDFTFIMISNNPTTKVGVDYSFWDGGQPITISNLSTDINLANLSSLRAPTGSLISTSDLTMTINALKQTSNSVSIITGSQTVLSNREAQLDSVQELPISQNNLSSVGGGSTGSSGVVSGSISYKDVGTRTRVFPKALDGKRVLVPLNIEVSSVSGFTDVGGQQVPNTTKQKFATEVVIEEGMSLAMGGLESSIVTDKTRKIPGLGDIPFFGFPFKSISKENQRVRIILFVTPHIIGHKGGNLNGQFKVGPTISQTGRKQFDAKPGLSLDDVRASLAGMTEDIESIELAVKGGRGDSTVRKDANLIVNECDLMLVTIDENRLRGSEDKSLREQINAYRKRASSAAKNSVLQSL